MTTATRRPTNLWAYFTALRLQVRGLGPTKVRPEPRRSSVIDRIHERARARREQP